MSCQFFQPFQQVIRSSESGIRKGGILRIATDHKVYKAWTLRTMHECPDFKWTAKCSDDWRNPPADWVETKYQQKALREGRKPVFFDYERI